MKSTNIERFTDTINFSHTKLTGPTITHADKIMAAISDFASVCDGGSGELRVAEIDGVCETFNVGGFHVGFICAVVLW